MEILGWILFVAGVLTAITTYVWVLAIAFRDHVGHGAACLICGCYFVIYCLRNLDTCLTPFAINIAATAAVYGGAAMAGIDLGI